MRPHLIVVQPGGLVRNGEGRIALSSKTISGMGAYLDSWPGPVTLLAKELAEDPSRNLDVLWIDAASLDFGVELCADVLAAITRLHADVVLAPLAQANLGLLESGDPIVWVLENPPLQQLRYARVLGMPARDLPRAAAGTWRASRALAGALKHAAGVQCNGPTAYSWSRRHTPNALLYFDTRLTKAMVRSSTIEHPPGRLRLGFSGRLVATKGPDHAVGVFRDLTERGVPVDLTVFGDGPMAADLMAAAPEVAWAGEVDFARTWVSRVPAEVDVMLLPHPQGDPSGTYLESAGLGVPVLGYANTHWAPLAQAEGLGWAVRLGNRRVLAEKALELSGDRNAVLEAGERGRAFMRSHHFEVEFNRRVDHLLSVVG